MRCAAVLMAMAVVAFAGAGIASGAASDFDEVKAASLQYVLARGAQ